MLVYTFLWASRLVGPDELRGLDDERELLLHVLLCDGVALGMRGKAALRTNANSVVVT